MDVEVAEIATVEPLIGQARIPTDIAAESNTTSVRRGEFQGQFMQRMGRVGDGELPHEAEGVEMDVANRAAVGEATANWIGTGSAWRSGRGRHGG